MTDLDPLDKCAAAIAGVRELYRVIDLGYGNGGCAVSYITHTNAPFPFFGTREQCQAYIDREAARACQEARPISVKPIWLSHLFTAAIHAITRVP